MIVRRSVGQRADAEAEQTPAAEANLALGALERNAAAVFVERLRAIGVRTAQRRQLDDRLSMQFDAAELQRRQQLVMRFVHDERRFQRNDQRVHVGRQVCLQQLCIVYLITLNKNKT